MLKASLKKKDVLFDMMLDISNNLKECAKYFNEQKINSQSSLYEFQKNVKIFEEKGEKFLFLIIEELNRCFITPIEREDLLLLATNIDSVIGEINRCSARMYMYNIIRPDHYMIEFADLSYAATEEIYKAVKFLTEKKLHLIKDSLSIIKDCEARCDVLEMESIKELFEKEKDIFKLIKYKEIYEILETISDKCKGIANTLETIIMKNA